MSQQQWSQRTLEGTAAPQPQAQLTDEQRAMGMRWLSLGEAKDMLVAEKQESVTRQYGYWMRQLERHGQYHPVDNPEGIRMVAGEQKKELSPTDFNEIDFSCRTLALGCVKAGMRAAMLGEAHIAAEVHTALHYLAACDTTKEEWRGFTFLYRPNVYPSFDKLLDPEVPHMPAHIRHLYVQQA